MIFLSANIPALTLAIEKAQADVEHFRRQQMIANAVEGVKGGGWCKNFVDNDLPTARPPVSRFFPQNSHGGR